MRSARSLSHAGIVSRRPKISSIFSPPGSHTTLVFRTKRYDNIPTGTLNGGIEYEGGMEKLRFSINVSFYLGNDTRYDHSYYGMRIGNCTQAFEWYHFR